MTKILRLDYFCFKFEVKFANFTHRDLHRENAKFGLVKFGIKFCFQMCGAIACFKFVRRRIFAFRRGGNEPSEGAYK
ncbi:hypothetical protein CAMSH0001_1626 [Campylobacter showae RM3277]|uniref:Uncharacterized protein n=1 Tax=Campylobacter showae RM3277 TaxID=553219 RepID=C6RGZ2_9BACT|nr:hypothetical protein CAMSH0001_1626 [Campylobacter showae RM3277]